MVFTFCRWRDVKLRAFENADHRTYVDLKVIVYFGYICENGNIFFSKEVIISSRRIQRNLPLPYFYFIFDFLNIWLSLS
jgi:hypothetical protein